MDGVAWINVLEKVGRRENRGERIYTDVLPCDEIFGGVDGQAGEHVECGVHEEERSI
jgi:hypothetical protein